MQKLLETDMTEVTFHQEEALEEASLVVAEAGGGGGRNGRKISHKKSSHSHMATFENKRGCFTYI